MLGFTLLGFFIPVRREKSTGVRIQCFFFPRGKIVGAWYNDFGLALT